MKDWFKSWFDSPYYHLLYKDRNEQEAQFFLQNLAGRLRLPPGASILDQACGRGRHARFLASLGFYVEGIDLSQQNISYCKQFETESLRFAVHDMRRLYCTNCFDYVFNLFTSIGYFRHDHDQQLAVSSAAAALKPRGCFVIDFMNSSKVIRDLVTHEVKTINHVEFHISKKVENGFIHKSIEFEDAGKSFNFVEQVRIITKDDFEKYFRHAGLKLLEAMGDYELRPFDESVSNRLILVAEKL